jgi:diguanylate cyclase (GGDEF)-like protein
VDSGYRYGGDEFAIILIEADITVAEEIGSRVQVSLEEKVKITASIGFAIFKEGMSVKDLVAEADKDLYKSKGSRKASATA